MEVFGTQPPCHQKDLPSASSPPKCNLSCHQGVLPCLLTLKTSASNYTVDEQYSIWYLWSDQVGGFWLLCTFDSPSASLKKLLSLQYGYVWHSRLIVTHTRLKILLKSPRKLWIYTKLACNQSGELADSHLVVARLPWWQDECKPQGKSVLLSVYLWSLNLQLQWHRYRRIVS